MYDTFLASSFRSIRFGINEAHGRGVALQLNFLLDYGAYAIHKDGTFSVNREKIRDGVLALTREIMTLEAEGNYAKAQDLLSRMGVVRPEVQKMLDKLEHLPVDIEPKFTTAEKLMAEFPEQKTSPLYNSTSAGYGKIIDKIKYCIKKKREIPGCPLRIRPTRRAATSIDLDSNHPTVVSCIGMETLKIEAILLMLDCNSETGTPPIAGVMVTCAGRSVLAMDGPTLASGTIITLVTIDNPQQVLCAVVANRLTDSEIMAKHEVPAPYYAITAVSASNVLPSLAVAIIGRYEFERRGLAVVLRSGKTVNQIGVRGCTSSEGLHLTLWAGEPLKGKRLWHMYYYLGYDVEPTCQPADYQDGG